MSESSAKEQQSGKPAMYWMMGGDPRLIYWLEGETVMYRFGKGEPLPSILDKSDFMLWLGRGWFVPAENQ